MSGFQPQGKGLMLNAENCNEHNSQTVLGKNYGFSVGDVPYLQLYLHMPQIFKGLIGNQPSHMYHWKYFKPTTSSKHLHVLDNQH